MTRASGSFSLRLLFSLATLLASTTPSVYGQIDDAADLHTQQAQEKHELGDMQKEIDDIKNSMQNTMKEMSKVHSMMTSGAQSKEIRLQAKDAMWEAFPGCFVNGLCYNNTTPGPAIRVAEGDQVKITVQNAMSTPTSLYIQGMQLPHKVDGLPRKGSGLIGPGESFTYQFVAGQPGTYYYRPHVPHLDQLQKGLVGALIVEPKHMPKTYEVDHVLILTQAHSGQITRKPASPNKSSNLFLVNGKSAQAIAPMEVKNGERVRLRVINASPESCTFTLTGHKLEIVAQNGSDSTEPHTTRDTITINSGERMDIEFTADNPGVWSLSSLNASQTTFNGQFPGGFAMVVRYPDNMRSGE